MEKKILVVDDEAPIRLLLDKVLTKAGFTVTTAESAEAAIDILGKDQIQIMFIDLKLPGMNGIELCRRIRKENPIACIYSMTGYGSLFELADYREAGFDDYFLKPIDMEVFIKTAGDAYEKLARWRKR